MIVNIRFRKLHRYMCI